MTSKLLSHGKHRVSIGLIVFLLLSSSFFALLSLDTAYADQVVATMSLGGYYPFDVDVNPNTNKVYVTTYNRVTYNTSYLFVIDGTTNNVIATLSPQAYDDSFEGVAVNPNTNKIYAANFAYSGISVIDGATNTLTKFIPDVSFPHYLAVNPSTNKIYVMSNNRDVFVIDGSTNTIIKYLQGPCGTYGPPGSISPGDVAVNPLTNMAYVSCVKAVRVACPPCYQSVASYVAVIDGSTDTVMKNITLGGSNTWVGGIRVNPSTNRIYVGGSPSAYVIDGNTNLLMSTIDAGCGCAGRVGVNPSTDKVYFSDAKSSITVVDGATNTVIGSVVVGNEPRSIGVNPATNKIYVANSASQTVSVIDGNSVSTTTSQLTVNTQDTLGTSISGYYTVIYQNGNNVAEGYSPATFTLNNGEQYTVQVQDYGNFIFDHWLDTGSRDRDRDISITADTQITAAYRDINAPPPAGQSKISVKTVGLLGFEIIGYYTTLWQGGTMIDSCFSPCSFFVNNGAAYQVAVADYGGETFTAWSDGTLDRFHMVEIGSVSTTISLTAIYRP